MMVLFLQQFVTCLEEELILVLVEGDVHESTTEAVVGEDKEDLLQ